MNILLRLIFLIGVMASAPVMAQIDLKAINNAIVEDDAKQFDSLMRKSSKNVNSVLTSESIVETAAMFGSDDVLLLYLANLTDYGNPLGIVSLSSALLTACGNSYLSTVKLLVEFGADVDSKSKHDGSTCLHYAVSRTSVEIVSFLMKAGASKSLKNDSGTSPVELRDQLVLDLNKIEKLFH